MRFSDSEFLLGVEPRRDHQTHKVWFTLNCDGADKGHPLCAGRAGTQSVLGALSSRSSVIFDLDEDGDLDIVTNDFNDRPQILISNLTEKKPIHFLKVRLVGTKSNRDGLGATVQVRAGGHKLTQYHDGKSGYLSQSSLTLYFGLGEAGTAEAVEVTWPSGQHTATNNIAANQTLRVVEPAR